MGDGSGLKRKRPLKRGTKKLQSRTAIRKVNPARKSRRKRRYLEYLRSSAWKSKRAKRLALDNRTCQHCGYCPDTASPDTAKRPLDCHHRTYLRFGKEDVERDLVTLCRPCHEQEEGRLRPWNARRGSDTA